MIRYLLTVDDIDIMLLGKDKQFSGFQDALCKAFPAFIDRFRFVPATSVDHLVRIVDCVDILLTVNTAVVHMGHAFNKKMIVLTGPTLDLWNPTGDNICLIRDEQAIFRGADKVTGDQRLPQVARIKVEQVIAGLFTSLAR